MSSNEKHCPYWSFERISCGKPSTNLKCKSLLIFCTLQLCSTKVVLNKKQIDGKIFSINKMQNLQTLYNETR